MQWTLSLSSTIQNHTLFHSLFLIACLYFVMFFSMTTITYMTGHHGLPADIDDKLNSRELHGGWSWVEERVVLSRVTNLGNKMLATCCMANLDRWLCVCWRVPSPPRPPIHTQREREGSPLFHVTEQVPPGPEQEFFRTPLVLRLKYFHLWQGKEVHIVQNPPGLELQQGTHRLPSGWESIWSRAPQESPWPWRCKM